MRNKFTPTPPPGGASVPTNTSSRPNRDGSTNRDGKPRFQTDVKALIRTYKKVAYLWFLRVNPISPQIHPEFTPNSPQPQFHPNQGPRFTPWPIFWAFCKNYNLYAGGKFLFCAWNFLKLFHKNFQKMMKFAIFYLSLVQLDRSRNETVSWIGRNGEVVWCRYWRRRKIWIDQSCDSEQTDQSRDNLYK